MLSCIYVYSRLNKLFILKINSNNNERNGVIARLLIIRSRRDETTEKVGNGVVSGKVEKAKVSTL